MDDSTNIRRIGLPTAIRTCVVLSCGILAIIACSEAQQRSPPPPPTNEQTESTPASQTSASGIPPLTEQDSVRLEERFPKRQREVLQNAKHVDVYELGDCQFPEKGGPNDQGLWPIEKNKFQGCRVLRRARVSDPAERKGLVDTILYSIGSSHMGNACFWPRHGIRAVHDGQLIELLICFECENFKGAPVFRSGSLRDPAGNWIGPPTEKFSGGFSPAAEPLFERILSRKSSNRR